MNVGDVSDLAADRIELGELGPRAFRAALGVGIAGLALGFGLAAGGVEGFFHSYLVSFAFFLSLSLGALFFVLITMISRAGWSVSVRRLAEAFASNLVLPLPVLFLPLAAGIGTLYPWSRPEVVTHEPLLQGKTAWLNVPFFLARTAVCLLVWAALAGWFWRTSTRQDRTGDPRLTVRMEKASGPALVLFALTVTVFSFDHLMSLDPTWYSTIFGVYVFSGSALGFLAFLVVAAWAAQKAGLLGEAVHVEHYHDLGKLVFGFVVFWAYIGFSQYMLIWYANLPEEVPWYLRRQTGPWMWVSLLLLFGHFLLPFFLLVGRWGKRRPGVLAAASLWLLLVQWVDLYWIVMPEWSRERVPLSVMDLATWAGVGGIWVAAAVRRLGAVPLVPLKDPRLSESLGYENA
jgi:hypothetical protein